MFWDQLTSPEIDALDRNIPVILPVAATEQHGPHLPLATDRMIGEHFCRRLNKSIPDSVLILPCVSIGCSEHHTDFAGSLSVQHTTFLAQLTDVANCVVKYGFKNLLVFNSHGGNQAIGQTFLEAFGYRNPSCRIALATWWRLAIAALKQLSDTAPGGTGHAGELETSLMLLIAPELVRLDKIQPKVNTPTFGWADGDMLYGAAASLYESMKQKTPNGTFGEPRAGSQEKGERITIAVTKALEGIVLDLYKADRFI